MSGTHDSNVSGMTPDEAYWTGWANQIRQQVRQEAAAMTPDQVERHEEDAKRRYDETGSQEDYIRYQEWYGIGYVMQPSFPGAGDGMAYYDPSKDGEAAVSTVQIVMEDRDFGHLITNAMRWAGEDWEPQIAAGRFLVGGQMDVRPRPDWKWAYWLGAEYAAVILARAYLDSQNARYEISSDETGGEWLILTDYEWGRAW